MLGSSGLEYMIGSHEQLLVGFVFSSRHDDTRQRTRVGHGIDVALPLLSLLLTKQADTFYRQFEIPLLETLDNYKASVTVRLTVYSQIALARDPSLAFLTCKNPSLDASQSRTDKLNTKSPAMRNRP
jgi:hypothetical protein